MRPRHQSVAEAQILPQSDDQGPGILPIDSAKTFIGPHGTYYDERWRWMEWRGESRSWNGAAALTFGCWLAYRRLYAHAGLHLVWVGFLALLAFDGVPLRFVAILQLLAALVVGLYGNTWYQQRFRQAAADAARVSGGHDARLAALAATGGVDLNAARLLATATIGVVALVAVTVHMVTGIVLRF